MTITAVFSLLTSLSVGLLSGGFFRDHLRVVSQSEAVVSAYTNSSTAELQVRQILCEDSGGRRHTLLIVFDPQWKSFNWVGTSASQSDRGSGPNLIGLLRDDWGVFIRAGHVVLISGTTLPTGVQIKDAYYKANSLDDAESRVLEEVGKLQRVSDAFNQTVDVHLIPLAGISREFSIDPLSAQAGGPPRVKHITWDGDRWVVRLESRWIEDVVIDSKYKLVSIAKVH